MKKTTSFAGIRFDHFRLDELVDFLFATEQSKIVVTPNVDHVVRANEDSSFMALYQQADISVNDSRILKKLTSLIHVDVGDVVPGSDLTRTIIEKISGSQTPITIIGSSEEAVALIKEKYDLPFVNHYNPPMGFIKKQDEVAKCVDLIVQNRAKFIFLAVGSPRQEMLALKAREAGAEGIFLCIGASLMFLSGDEIRAPKLIQKLSLEWLFRMLQSPRRLAGRYLHDFTSIIPLLLRERKRLKVAKKEGTES